VIGLIDSNNDPTFIVLDLVVGARADDAHGTVAFEAMVPTKLNERDICLQTLYHVRQEEHDAVAQNLS